MGIQYQMEKKDLAILNHILKSFYPLKSLRIPNSLGKRPNLTEG